MLCECTRTRKEDTVKYTTIRWAVTSALIVLTAGTARVAAQGPNKHHSYILVDMGTLGGPSSSASGPCCKIVNNSGTFIGVADTDVLNPYPNGDPDEPSLFYTHAFTWRNGVRTDLGALPGGGTGATW